MRAEESHEALARYLVGYGLHLDDDLDFEQSESLDALKQALADFDPQAPETAGLRKPIESAIDVFKIIVNRGEPHAVGATAAWGRLQRNAPAYAVVEPEPEGPFSLSPALDFQELLAADLKPLEFIVAPFLPEAGAGLLFGPPGVAKTWIAHQLALCVATGEPFLAWQVGKRRPVLLIDGELSKVLLQKRLRMVQGESEPPGRGWLQVLCSEDLLRVCGRVIDFGDKAHRDHLLRLLKWMRDDPDQRAPKLLILDNLAALFTTLEENSNEAVALVNSWLNQIRFLGIALLLVHHSPKDGIGRGPRGASALTGSMDFVASLDPFPDSDHPHFTLKFVKQRHEPVPQASLDVEIVRQGDAAVEFQINGPGSTPARDILIAIHEHQPTSIRELAGKVPLKRSRVDQVVRELRQRNLLDSFHLTSEGKRYAGLE